MTILQWNSKGLAKSVRYNEDSLYQVFYYHWGVKAIVRYIEDLVT